MTCDRTLCIRGSIATPQAFIREQGEYGNLRDWHEGQLNQNTRLVRQGGKMMASSIPTRINSGASTHRRNQTQYATERSSDRIKDARF
ncbi:hypothetical protein QUB63_06710 [Microcoleus sp. ARI1-B5]|uniref:hypothetical protein n=1 Tax=unclassified Microcoleus TaxID=2642155 RepID=UPI002FD3C391